MLPHLKTDWLCCLYPYHQTSRAVDDDGNVLYYYPHDETATATASCSLLFLLFCCCGVDLHLLSVPHSVFSQMHAGILLPLVYSSSSFPPPLVVLFQNSQGKVYELRYIIGRAEPASYYLVRKTEDVQLRAFPSYFYAYIKRDHVNKFQSTWGYGSTRRK